MSRCAKGRRYRKENVGELYAYFEVECFAKTSSFGELSRCEVHVALNDHQLLAVLLLSKNC